MMERQKMGLWGNTVCVVREVTPEEIFMKVKNHY